MDRDPLDETVKVRIPAEWKSELKREAASEHLDLSDIVRRAIAEYIERNRADLQEAEV